MLSLNIVGGRKLSTKTTIHKKNDFFPTVLDNSIEIDE